MGDRGRGDRMDAAITPAFHSLCNTLAVSLDVQAAPGSLLWERAYRAALMDIARRAVELIARATCGVADVAPGGALTPAETERVIAEMARRLRVIEETSAAIMRGASPGQGGRA